MVFSSLMILALANSTDEFTRSFSGIWASTTGNMLIIREKVVSLYDPERVADCKPKSVTEQGGLYFTWVANGKLMPHPVSEEFYQSDGKKTYYGPWAVIREPETAVYKGEGLITLGRPDARNVIRDVRVETNKTRGPQYMLGQFTFAAPLRIISFAGNFGSNRTNISLAEEYNASAGNFDISGTLTVDGVKCTLKGSRAYERAVLSAVDPVRGTPIGRCVLFWRPTGDTLRKIMGRDTTETDQILAFFDIKGVALRSPEKIFMPRIK